MNIFQKICATAFVLTAFAVHAEDRTSPQSREKNAIRECAEKVTPQTPLRDDVVASKVFADCLESSEHESGSKKESSKSHGTVNAKDGKLKIE
jgi:hypothetical protein